MLAPSVGVAQEPAARMRVEVPAGEVAVALQQMAVQTGLQIIFRPDTLAGVQARAVHGSYFPQEALDLLLAGTPLVAVPDKASGAFAVIFRDTVQDAGAPVARSSPEPSPTTSLPESRLPSPQESQMNTKRSFLSRIFGTLFCNGDTAESNSAAPRKNGAAGLRTAVGLAVASAVGLPATAQAQTATGAIEGRVINAATGLALNNARVTVEGTRLEVFTDENGGYRLRNIPSGEVRLRATYTGMEARAESLNVTSGGLARKDFSLAFARGVTTYGADVVQLGQFIVEATQVSAVAAAQNERKVAPNIKDIVVFDEIGDLGDGNMGEYLKYTPGITIRQTGTDAAAISIRGMPGETVVVLIDGHQHGNMADDRVFALPGTSPSNVDRIEVTKSPTPDRPANSVGGTVNVISKSARNIAKRRLTIDANATYNSFDGIRLPGLSERYQTDDFSNNRMRKIQPGLAVSWEHPVNEKFAYNLRLQETRRFSVQEQHNQVWDMVNGLLTRSNPQGNTGYRSRALAAASADWRISRRDSLRFTLESVMNYSEGTRPTFRVDMGANSRTVLTGPVAYAQGAANGVDSLRSSTSISLRDYGTDTAGISYRHDGDVYKIDVRASHSTAYDKRQGTNKGTFTGMGDMTLSNLVIRMDDITGIYDGRAPQFSAINRAGNRVDPYDNSFMTVPMGVNNRLRIVDAMRTVSADVSRSFTAPLPTMLKAGVLISNQRKDRTQHNERWNFTPPAGVATNVGSYDLNDNGLSNMTAQQGTLKADYVSPRKLYQFMKANPTWFTYDAPTSFTNWARNSAFFEETIRAGYVRGDVKLLNNQVWLVGGVRFEETENNGAGVKNDIGATYQRDASGRILRDAAGRPIPITTDALASAKLRYTERAARAHKQYSSYYPSLNGTWYVNDKFLVRAAIASTMGRPNLTSTIPGLTIPDPNSTSQVLSLANTALKPWTAKTYDISLETYEVKGASLAVSGFKKEVKNFFVSSVAPVSPELMEVYGLGPEFSSYLVSTQFNGSDTASIRGMEFSWRQNWTFLPSWAKGVSTFLNYTRTLRGGPAGLSLSSVNAGFGRKSINYGINYSRKNLSVRYNVADIDEIVHYTIAASSTVLPGSYHRVAPQLIQDLYVEYRFAKRYTAYLSGRNLGNSLDARENYNAALPPAMRPNQVRPYGTLTTLGVRAEF